MVSLTKKKILIDCNSTIAYKYFLTNLVHELTSLNNDIYLLVGKDNQNKSINFENKKNLYFIEMPKRNLINIFSFIKQ